MALSVASPLVRASQDNLDVLKEVFKRRQSEAEKDPTTKFVYNSRNPDQAPITGDIVVTHDYNDSEWNNCLAVSIALVSPEESVVRIVKKIKKEHFQEKTIILLNKNLWWV